MAEYRFLHHEPIADRRISLHEPNQAHRDQVHDDGWPVAEERDGVPDRREAPPIVRATEDQVRAQP